MSWLTLIVKLNANEKFVEMEIESSFIEMNRFIKALAAMESAIADS